MLTPLPLCSFESIENSTNKFYGKCLEIFGQAIEVWDTEKKQHVYYSKHHLVKALLGENADLSKMNQIVEKILEVVNPFTQQKVTLTDLKQCYEMVAHQTETYESCIDKLESIKKQLHPVNQFTYEKDLSELGEILQPGDIIVRKYHEDNANPICTLQKIFRKSAYREAYKFSHVAIYLGKKSDGKYWVAEASLPKDNDPQIRRLQIDDEKFNLKDKNQYLVIRNANHEVAKETARIANLYALKMLPVKEALSNVQDRESSVKYNHFEALRSLWHSNKFDYFAKQRIFKYYSDYSNKIPFQYITDKRKLFCSQFSFLSIQMAEAKKSEVFQEIMSENPPPANNENQYTGIAKFFAKVSYVVRRAFWSRMMAIKYSQKMDQAFTTKVDFLRTTPQDTVNYLLVNNNNYKAVGFINKSK